MAEINWPAFGRCVDDECARRGLSVRGAVSAFPGTNVALWSRARRGRQPLSAENYLLVCKLLSIDPWRFFSAAPKQPGRTAGRSLRAILRSMKKQAVTAAVSREAGSDLR